jgi:hypothetical protein
MAPQRIALYLGALGSEHEAGEVLWSELRKTRGAEHATLADIATL